MLFLLLTPSSLHLPIYKPLLISLLTLLPPPSAPPSFPLRSLYPLPYHPISLGAKPIVPSETDP